MDTRPQKLLVVLAVSLSIIGTIAVGSAAMLGREDGITAAVVAMVGVAMCLGFIAVLVALHDIHTAILNRNSDLNN